MGKLSLSPGFYGAFYKGTRPGLPGLFNRFVRFWDHGPYSHCELLFSDGLSASSSFLDGGVRFKAIEFDADHWDIFEMPADREARARAWFEANKGAQYDLMADMRFLVGPLSHSAGRFNCSSAWAEAMGFAESWRFSPNMLAALCRTASLPIADPPLDLALA